MYSSQFLFTVLSVNSISRINFLVDTGRKVKKKKKKKRPGRAALWNAFIWHFTQQDLPGSVFWPCSLELCPRQMGKPKGEPPSGRERPRNQPVASRWNDTCEWPWWNNGSVSCELHPGALHHPGQIQLYHGPSRSALHWSSPCRKHKGSVTAQTPQLCPLFVLWSVTKGRLFHHQMCLVGLLL